MSYYEKKFEELKNIKVTLNALIDSVNDKHYVTVLENISKQVEKDMDNMSDELYDRELA